MISGLMKTSSLWSVRGAMVAPSDRAVVPTELESGAGVGRGGGYMRKTPKRDSRGGALRAAESPRASTVRVSAGSTMPSSQMRALA